MKPRALACWPMYPSRAAGTSGRDERPAGYHPSPRARTSNEHKLPHVGETNGPSGERLAPGLPVVGRRAVDGM